MEINKPVSTVIITIIILILAFLFVLPKYQESKALETEVAQKQAEYNGKAVYYAKIAELLSNIQSKKDALAKIDNSMPSDFSLSSLAYFFQKKGAENGLTVRSMVFSQTSPAVFTRNSSQNNNKDIKDNIFTIDLLGDYQGFKNFLHAMESSSRLFEVNTISFSLFEPLQVKKQPKNQPSIYDFKLEIIAHTY